MPDWLWEYVTLDVGEPLWTLVAWHAVLVTVCWLLARRRRAANPPADQRGRAGWLEKTLTVVAASIATGVSAQGMWRFAGDVLGLDGPLRLVLFAFIEVAIVTSAVRARRSMRERNAAGVDGVAVWVLTCLTAVLSALDARMLAEAVFRLVAPLVAAWLWERGMAIDRPGRGAWSRVHWRVTPERVLVALRLAEPTDRTASEVATQRRMKRAALAAEAVRLAEEGTRAYRRAQKRFRARMRELVAHTTITDDPYLQAAFGRQVASLFGADQVLEIDPAGAWYHAPEGGTNPVLVTPPAGGTKGGTNPALVTPPQGGTKGGTRGGTSAPPKGGTKASGKGGTKARRLSSRGMSDEDLLPLVAEIADEYEAANGGAELTINGLTKAMRIGDPRARRLINQYYGRHTNGQVLSVNGSHGGS